MDNLPEMRVSLKKSTGIAAIERVGVDNAREKKRESGGFFCRKVRIDIPQFFESNPVRFLQNLEKAFGRK
jgi:hypothetical protein